MLLTLLLMLMDSLLNLFYYFNLNFKLYLIST